MHARGFGAAQERADVVGIFQRIEHEDERRLVAFRGPGQDVVQACELPGLDDERDTLVAIEAGERRERPAFDLDDRDPKVRRVEYQLLEGGAALGYDQEADGGASRDEGLLDGTSAGDELLLVAERLRRRQRRGPGRTTVSRLKGRALVRAPAFGPRAVWSIGTGAATAGWASERSPTGRPAPAWSVARAIAARTEGSAFAGRSRSISVAAIRAGPPVVRPPRFVARPVARLVGLAIPGPRPRRRPESIARSGPRTTSIGPGA